MAVWTDSYGNARAVFVGSDGSPIDSEALTLGTSSSQPAVACAQGSCYVAFSPQGANAVALQRFDLNTYATAPMQETELNSCQQGTAFAALALSGGKLAVALTCDRGPAATEVSLQRLSTDLVPLAPPLPVATCSTGFLHAAAIEATSNGYGIVWSCGDKIYAQYGSALGALLGFGPFEVGSKPSHGVFGGMSARGDRLAVLLYSGQLPQRALRAALVTPSGLIAAPTLWTSQSDNPFVVDIVPYRDGWGVQLEPRSSTYLPLRYEFLPVTLDGTAGPLIDLSEVTSTATTGDGTAAYPDALLTTFARVDRHWDPRLRFVEASGQVQAGTALTSEEPPQVEPAIAFGANEYFIAWSERHVTTGYDILAVRLDAGGELLDAEPIVIANTEAEESLPRVLFDGSGFRVAWLERKRESCDLPGPYGTNCWDVGGVLTVVVAPSGALLPESRAALRVEGVADFALSRQGSRLVLVTLENDDLTLRTTRYLASGSADSTPVTLDTVPARRDFGGIEVACRTGCTVVWSPIVDAGDYFNPATAKLRASRLGVDFALLDPQPLTIQSASGKSAPLEFALGSLPDRDLVVWKDGYGLNGALLVEMSSPPIVRLANPILPTETPLHWLTLAPSSDGFLVASWAYHNQEDFLRFVVADADGVATLAGDIAVSSPPPEGGGVAVAANTANQAIAVFHGRSLTNPKADYARLRRLSVDMADVLDAGLQPEPDGALDAGSSTDSDPGHEAGGLDADPGTDGGAASEGGLATPDASDTSAPDAGPQDGEATGAATEAAEALEPLGASGGCAIGRAGHHRASCMALLAALAAAWAGRRRRG